MLPEQVEYFDRLYDRYFRTIRRMANSLVNNPSLAEEFAQDTFHDVVQQIEEVMNHPAPCNWLMLVCKRKIYHYYEARNRDLELMTKLKQQALTEPGAVESAEAAAEARMSDGLTAEEKIRVHLTPEEWEFLRRITLEKASHLEMAKERDITVWNSQKQLERIRKRLDKVFPNYRKKKFLTNFLILCQVLLFLYIL